MNTQRSNLTVAGVMTGNSLDAVDVGTFNVEVCDGAVQGFEQIGFHSEACSPELRAEILALKAALKESRGVVRAEMDGELAKVSAVYHQEVNAALSAARAAVLATHGREIDLIGLHGQTLGHAPPSVTRLAGVDAGQRPYTIQLGDGGVIADAQKVVTVADFRSRDLLNGGEGAPFAPGFNALLTPALGVESAAFVNAGNTSNIAIIRSSTLDVRGWDCGPCNQFPDLLMREERGESVDRDGKVAASGKVRPDLLEKLWHTSVARDDGSNALELRGPRSFDPQWYKLPQDLREATTPFPDRMRTVVAFSAYCVAHSLAIAVSEGYQPTLILLFGGGWKNPTLLQELNDLCSGKADYVLPEHVDLFASLSNTVLRTGAKIRFSDDVGLPSNGMEAGIFAFAAVQRILNQPFTRPSFTNCSAPTVCGEVFLPEGLTVPRSLPVAQPLKDARPLFRDRRLGLASPSNW